MQKALPIIKRALKVFLIILIPIFAFSFYLAYRDYYPYIPEFSDKEMIEIAGADANQNGVRDDVEAYINENYKEEKLNKALMNYAAAMQGAITKVNTEEDAKFYQDQYTKAIACTTFNVDTSVDITASSKLTNVLDEIILNSKKRQKAFDKFTTLHGAYGGRDIKDEKTECQF